MEVVRLPFETKNPALLSAGFGDLALLVAYTPARPALVGEVISTSTRSKAAPLAALASFIVGVWRCNIGLEEHASMGLVKQVRTNPTNRCIKAMRQTC